jgi:hypothetical protein
MLLIIDNNGPEIAYTNYFDTKAAEAGYTYLSTNAGVFRLLIADKMIFEINDWWKAREVIISRGPWTSEGKPDALEIMFEDYTNAPCLHIMPEQVDRMPIDDDQDQQGTPPRWKLAVWTRHGKMLELPCRYRRTPKIPWVKAWHKN